jgi:hypothetical protein
MWDFSIGRALAAVLRSWPFLLVRLALYSAIAFTYLALMGTGAGVGYGVGHVSSDPGTPVFGAVVGGISGFALAWFLFRLLAEYILYVVKAGHVAVLLHLLEGRTVPGAMEQVSYARSVVQARFAEASLLFVLDQLIKAVLRTTAALLRGIASFVPIPGLRGLIAFFNLVVAMSLTYADEVVLAYNIRSGVNEPWETSRRGLVLYAQNGRNILKNAFWLALIVWAIAIAIFLMALSPAAALVYLVPGQPAGWSFVAALVLTWACIAAFVEPFAIACLMQAYFKAIEGQEPDAEWDARLSQASRQFREIKDRAASAFGGRPASPLDPAAEKV